MDASVDVYLRRAEQFADAMRLCREDVAYTAATALLAVHSSISYNDALYLKLAGRRRKSQDHKTAITDTKRVCARRGVAFSGLPHLQKLIGAKTDISYGDKRVESELAKTLCLSAERFEAWAVPIIKS
jgi:hypothetical protein